MNLHWKLSADSHVADLNARLRVRQCILCREGVCSCGGDPGLECWTAELSVPAARVLAGSDTCYLTREDAQREAVHLLRDVLGNHKEPT